MTTMTRADALFARFLEPYRAYGEKIQMKIDHTMRVRDLCVDVAESFALGAPDVALASDCGLLHDIGRFEQWRRYGTYNDAKSLDHGDLGAEILQGLLGTDDWDRAFSKADSGTVVTAVRYHNKYRLPSGLGERDRLFAAITRDADKLDILHSYATGLLTYHSPNTAMSEAVLQAVLSGRGVRRQEVSTKADELAGKLAFVFDLNLRAARTGS